MQNYTLEMHFHTSEVSDCAHVSASESVPILCAAGYDGVVVTDHYTPEFFASLPDSSWESKIDRFLSGYETARKAAVALAFDVFLGMEIRFSENSNDYLVYGLTRDFLLQHAHLHELGIRKFSRLCRMHGMLIYQAHPFRNRMTITPPQHLFGIESHNGNPRHDSRNDIATIWAQKHDLASISGSDYHQLGDESAGGLVFDQPLKENASLTRALVREDYVFMDKEAATKKEAAPSMRSAASCDQGPFS